MPVLLDMTVPYTTQDGVLESKLGDETVLLDMESGAYFGLDPVGSFVWQGLKAGKAPAQIVADLPEAFSEVPGSAEQDVLSFLQELAEKQLISPNG